MADNQQAIIQELYSRRAQLPPEKQAIVQELYARMTGPAKAPFAGNPARNRRQAFEAKGVSPEAKAARTDAVSGVIHSAPGFDQIMKGGHEIQQPGQRKLGASDLIRGAGKFAAPAMLPVAAVAAPAATAASLVAGSAAGAGAEGIATVAGADEGTAHLIGDAAGLAAGGAATREGNPEALGAAAKQAGKEIPGSGKVGRIVDAFEARKAAVKGTGEQPTSGVEEKALDEAAQSLGAKDFKSVTDPRQKEVIQQLAKAKGAAGLEPTAAPRPSPAAATPARAPRPEETPRPEVPTPVKAPRTINDEIDAHLAAKKAQAKPTPAPTSHNSPANEGGFPEVHDKEHPTTRQHTANAVDQKDLVRATWLRENKVDPGYIKAQLENFQNGGAEKLQQIHDKIADSGAIKNKAGKYDPVRGVKGYNSWARLLRETYGVDVPPITELPPTRAPGPR